MLNGTPERRDRAGFGQPRAATLREEPRAGRTPNIAREKKDPLAQGRILTRQEGVEGWPVQGGPMQVTHNHIIVPLLELGQGVLAIARRAGAEIVKLATQLIVTTVVLHPFVHLFAELSTPAVAIDVLSRTQHALSAASLWMYRTLFGWFNTLRIDAKGHPIARIARMVNADA